MSDNELCENAEADLKEEEDEDEEDEDEKRGAVGGARLRKYVCAESGLKPSARLRLYDNQNWRMEVTW